MPKSVAMLMPGTARRLSGLGERLRLARRRRGLTAKQIAERAGMTAETLRRLENGNASVTMGAYAAVLQVLGFDADLERLVEHDVLGRRLQDARLA